MPYNTKEASREEELGLAFNVPEQERENAPTQTGPQPGTPEFQDLSATQKADILLAQDKAKAEATKAPEAPPQASATKTSPGVTVTVDNSRVMATSAVPVKTDAIPPGLLAKVQAAQQRQSGFEQARNVGQQISQASAKAEEDIRREVKTRTGMEWLDKVAQGGMLGVVDALAGSVATPLIAIGVAGRGVEGKPDILIEEGKQLGTGVKEYFVDTLGRGLIDNPAETAPRVVVAFAPAIAEGGLGVIRGAKAVGLAATANQPARALKIELDVSRLPLKNYPKEKVLPLVGEAIEKQLSDAPGGEMSRTVTVNFPDGTTGELKYRITPMQKVAPDVLYHATPDATAFREQMRTTGKVAVQGELYESPQVAMDFMRRSASGAPPKDPAILAIRTGGELSAKEPTVYKIWKGSVENEIVAQQPVEYLVSDKNLYAKLKDQPTGTTLTQYTGPTDSAKVTAYIDPKTGKAVIPADVGKTYTITRGQIVPVYWLRKPGVSKGVPSVTQRYAATRLAIVETIKDIPYLRPDIKGLAKAIKKGEVELSWFSDSPLLESRRRTYSGLKITQDRIEAAIKERVRRGMSPEEAIARVTSEDVRRLAANRRIARALSDERVQESIRIKANRYLAMIDPTVRAEPTSRDGIDFRDRVRTSREPVVRTGDMERRESTRRTQGGRKNRRGKNRTR
jgi:hypothetical protein